MKLDPLDMLDATPTANAGKERALVMANIWQQETREIAASLDRARKRRNEWIDAAMKAGATEREAAMRIGMTHSMARKIKEAGNA